MSRVPARWDETRVLVGRPGEFVVMARRHGEDWYLGAMSGWAAREIELPLSFLGEGTYAASVFADDAESGNQPTKVHATAEEVSSGDRWKIVMAPGGGFAAHLKAPEKLSSP